jgi:hypothetical protein
MFADAHLWANLAIEINLHRVCLSFSTLQFILKNFANSPCRIIKSYYLCSPQMRNEGDRAKEERKAGQRSLKTAVKEKRQRTVRRR